MVKLFSGQGYLALPFDQDLTGFMFTHLQNELGQCIDSRAVQKLEFAHIQDQGIGFRVSGTDQEIENWLVFFAPCSRNDPPIVMTPVTSSYLMW